MRTHQRVRGAAAALVLCGLMLGAAAPAEAQRVRGAYLYTLATFTGPIPYNESRMAVDHERHEVYVLHQNTVHVFNASGMEVHRFGDDLDLGRKLDIAVDDRGDVLLLALRGTTTTITRCDYRGRPRGEIRVEGLRRDFRDFAPDRLAYRGGALYLASSMDLQLVITDAAGAVRKEYDLFRLFELEEKDRGVTELMGFNVDRDGNVLMTVPVLFRAFVLTPDGTLRSFGKAGGAPGRFNVVSGITRDSKGNFVVVDKLKGAVQVFDPTFAFVTQFAARGYRPGELIAPADVGVDSGDRVYVTQMGKRGISVFKLTYP